MAFPDDLTMVTVTHTIADAALRPLPGVVVATPTGRQWKQGEGSILPAEYTAPIEGGTWTLVLPAVDQFVNLEAYRIEERPTEGGKPWGRPYHIAPTLDHAPGPVDATDVITTPPRGGDIVFTAGPATDESMAQVAADPNSAFHSELTSTIDSGLDARVPGKVAEALADDDTPAQAAAAAVANAVEGLDLLDKPAADGYYQPIGDYLTDETADPAIAGAITSIGSATGDALAVVTTTASRNHTNVYVSPTGDDNNSGEFGSPYRTLAKALSRLPDVIRSDHLYNIRLEPGTWDETLDVKHLVVYGHLIIQGTTTNRADHKVHRVKFTKVYGTVTVRNLSTTIKDNTLPSFEYESSGPYMALTNVAAEYGPGEADGGSPTGVAVVGVLADRGSNVYVAGSDFSGKRYGMRANTLSKIFSSDNTGTGNHRGIGARFGGIMTAYGTQPDGLTPVTNASGGVVIHGGGGTIGPLFAAYQEPGLAQQLETLEGRFGRKTWFLRPYTEGVDLPAGDVPEGARLRFHFRIATNGPHTVEVAFSYVGTVNTVGRYVRKAFAGQITAANFHATPTDPSPLASVVPAGFDPDTMITAGHTGANGEFYIDVQAGPGEGIRTVWWGVDFEIANMLSGAAPTLYDVEIVPSP